MTDQQEPLPEAHREPVPPADPAAPETAREDQPAERRPALGDTVGTGTSIALGCVLGTVAIVIIGLLFLVLLMIFG